MRVLIVEDDEVIAQGLRLALAAQHYAVDIATDGRMGWNYATTCQYDVIVLDVMLPHLDGIQFCQKLRAQGTATPVLLLTAQNKPQLLIEGLDAGADDYVTKPFELSELLARLRALLRRGQPMSLPTLTWGDLTLDPSLCQVSWMDHPLKLTPKEYNLMELLLRNPQRIYSSSALIDHLWSLDSPPSEDTIRSHVKGLRQKLKAAGLPQDPIETVYGIGYRLRKAPSPIDRGIEQPTEPTAAIPAEMSKARAVGPIAQPPAASLTASPTASPTASQLSPPPALPMPSRAQSFSDGMEKLWQESQGKLTERLTCIHQALAAAQRQQLDRETAKSAESAAHKLVGTLGMFGGEEGSEIAKSVEHWFESFQAQIPLPVLDLEQQLCHLRRSIDQLNQTPLATTLLVSPNFSSARSQDSRVMVLNDDLQLREQLVSVLQPWGFEVIWLSGSAPLIESLQCYQPKLLILDVDLAPFSGIALCQTLRNTPAWAGLPVLMLNQHTDPDTLHRVFAVGADDCVSKPFIGPELVTRILNRLERSRLIQSLAETDPLTGTLNRRTLTQNAEMFLRLCERHHQPLTLAIVDIDQLKEINERYGDQAGDQVLVTCAQTLRSLLRQDDLIGRWSDHKFVILLYATGLQEIEQRFGSAIGQLRRHIFSTPHLSAPNPQAFKADLRTSLVQSNPGEHLADLLRRAEVNLIDPKTGHFWNRPLDPLLPLSLTS